MNKFLMLGAMVCGAVFFSFGDAAQAQPMRVRVGSPGYSQMNYRVSGRHVNHMGRRHSWHSNASHWNRRSFRG